MKATPRKSLQPLKDAYRLACAAYAEYGVDTDAAIKRALAVLISLHCWQADDVRGLETPKEGLAGGRGHERLALMEQTKAMPWGAVWDMLCVRAGTPPAVDWLDDVARYEEKVLPKRS